MRTLPVTANPPPARFASYLTFTDFVSPWSLSCPVASPEATLGYFSELLETVSSAVGNLPVSRYFSRICLLRSSIPVSSFVSGTIITMVSAVSLVRTSLAVPTMLSPAGPVALNSTDEAPWVVSLAWAERVTPRVRVEAMRPA
jgi:hypothetical protein